PVLLLTGAFEPVDQDRARDLRCDGVLTKTFEPQLVIKRVRELLATPAAERGRAAPPESAVTPAAPADSHSPIDEIDGVHTSSLSPLDQYFEQLEQAITARAFTRPEPSRPKVPLPDA